MATNLLAPVIDWLRKGYPEGIPAKDYPPLLALLQRSLSPEEVQAVVAQVISDNPDGDIARQSVAQAIEQVKAAPPNSDDVNEVAARLASVGWPLSVPDEQHDLAEQRQWPQFFAKIVDWLRAGYPDGVPRTDYLPILALLHRRLTDEEVKQVARELIASEKESGHRSGPIAEDDAQSLIQQVAGVSPSEEDLDRVRARLASKGWPLV